MKAIGIDKAIMKALSLDQNKNHNSIVLLIDADNSFVINGSEINGRLAFLLKMIKSYQKGAFEGKLNHNLCNIVENTRRNNPDIAFTNCYWAAISGLTNKIEHCTPHHPLAIFIEIIFILRNQLINMAAWKQAGTNWYWAAISGLTNLIE